jgi:hypothetical protein
MDKKSSKRPRGRPIAKVPEGTKISDPILAKHALEEFGVGWKWLRPRLERGEIRSQKVGNYLVLDRTDVARLAPNREEQQLVERALRRRSERTRGRK